MKMFEGWDDIEGYGLGVEGDGIAIEADGYANQIPDFNRSEGYGIA